MQELVMESDYEIFKVVPKYLDALPRPTKDESHSLDQKLIQRGQQIPIIVNEDMEILDGHSRFELLSTRGKRIKYQVMRFEDKQAEYEFVVETNVMKRQLNAFQRVEAMYQFFLQTKLDRRLLNREAHFDIFRALKEGAVTTKDLMAVTKYSKKTIHRLCKELTSANWISTTSKTMKSKAESGKTFGVKTFCFKLLPKGVEALDKSEPRPLGASLDLLGKVIGVKINSVQNAVSIIKSGNEEVIDLVRRDMISLNRGFIECYPTKKINRKGEQHVPWKADSQIKCPSCDKTHKRSEYTFVR